MRRIFSFLMAAFLLVSAAQASVSSSINELVHKTDPNINASIMVVDLTTGHTLYERQAQQTMIPASNMKLFSEAVAMLALGQNYRIPSTLSTDAKTLTNGRLNGSLYFHLSADPSLKHQAIFNMLQQLAKWNVKEISQDIVIQSDLDVLSPYPPGMNPKDEHYAYGAPVAPLILDENRLTVFVNPALQAGRAAVVETTSPVGVFEIENLITTKASAKGCGIAVSLDAEGKIHARGCVGVGQMVQTIRVPIYHPMAYLTQHIRYQLKQMGIVWHGQVRKGQMPTQAILIAKHESASLHELMAATLKPSDNLYANSLYLLAANHIRQAPSSWSQAQAVSKDFLQAQTGINLQSAVFAEGSGLSRYNRISAYQTLSLLTYLYTRFPLAFEYISSLPISGLDGTLRRRLNHPDQKGLVRAKTGTMTGIMSLSGYLLSKNGHTIAFAIYINTRHGTPPQVAGRYRGFIDGLCNLLLHSSPENIHHALFPFAHFKVAAPSLTATDGFNRRWASWRGVEYLLRRELAAQPVVVVYRSNELRIIDKGSSDQRIWSAIRKIQANRRFGVALESSTAPNLGGDSLKLLWIAAPNTTQSRQWILRPSV